jgi:putative endonuclease
MWPLLLFGADAMAFYVYMMCNKRNGTLHIGMTDNLVKRVWQHREGVIEGFTSHYAIKTLVWLDPHASRDSAFTRERQMKKWNRAWKLRLIEKQNPEWRDLWEEIAN